MSAVITPTTIGRFELRRRIGSGGFATVWLAHDPQLEAPVAVKVLADNWAHEADVRRRFVEEARLLRRVDSDHVVRVYDIGALDSGQPYFVMTYADGGCLAERLRDRPGPWPPEVVADLVDAVAAGLDVLHRNGIVHRDVKPSNVLLRTVAGAAGSAREAVVLGDLGIAKDLTWASGLTQPMGSAGYHAPEQAQYSADIGPATDVYALAIVAGQLLGLTGPPWDSPSPGASSWGASGGASASPELVAALTAATASDPARRTASAPEFAAAVRAALTRPASRASSLLVEPPSGPGLPAAEVVTETLLPSTGPGTPPPVTARPRRRRWVVAGALVGVLAVGAGSLAWSAGRRGHTFVYGRVQQALPAGWTATGGASVPGEGAGDGLRASGPSGSLVEVALATSTASPAVVAGRVQHGDCGAVAAAQVTSGPWRGSAFRWTSCPGGRIDEVALADPQRPGQVVWLRVSGADAPELSDVLSGLTIT